MAIQPPYPNYSVAPAQPLQQAGKGLWLFWILLTLVAFFIAFVSGIIAFAILFSAGMSGNQNEIWPFAVSITIVVAGAALIGWLQYRTLLRYIPLTRWWIVATIGGLAVGLVMSVVTISRLYALIDRAPGDDGIITAGLFFGAPALALGLAQWLIVRNYVRGAWVWIVAHGGAALAASGLLGVMARWWEIDWLQVILVMLCYAAITGGALVWLMRRRIGYGR